MKKEHFFLLILFVFLPIGIFAQVVQITDRYGTANVLEGEYRVYNNVWGASTPQTLEVNQSETYFKVISTGHNNTGGVPASYPFILKGSHFGGTPTTKNNPLPIQVQNISSAPFTWVIGTKDASGKWNAAFEAWFNKTGTGGNNDGELMIWINHHGGPSPAGSKVTTVEILGHTWDLYLNPSSNVISYKKTSVTDSISLDFKYFIHDAVNRGFLSTTWYLLAMEAGFEIWIDGKGLTSYSYSASAEEGLSTIITSPAIGATFSAPANITINASASSPDGSITKVEFFEGVTKLGESTTSPYSFTWSDVPEGSYTLTTKATDNLGATATSIPININVVPAPTGTSMEAENMILVNYLVNTNSSASSGKLIKLSGSGVTGNATFDFSGNTGTYDMEVWYYDENDGTCTFRVYVDNTKVEEWIANQNLGSPDPVAATRTSRTITGVTIANGAPIKLEAVQNGQEWGRYDNIKITESCTPVVSELIINQPKRFSLGQNYPNPFNPHTKIQFEIANATEIDLSVYNLLGNKVFTLCHGFYQRGKYSVRFDASDFPAGIYYYQLKTPNQRLTRKCLLIN